MVIGRPINQQRAIELEKLRQDERNWRVHWYGSTYGAAEDGRILVPHRPSSIFDAGMLVSLNTQHRWRWLCALVGFVPLIPVPLVFYLFGHDGASGAEVVLAMLGLGGWAVLSYNAVIGFMTNREV